MPLAEEEYVGPVIFEGRAAAGFFQQLLVTGMGGTPAREQPRSDMSMIFGESSDAPLPEKRRVMPPGWRVVDDPSAHPELAVGGAVDAEGTPTQRVEVIEDGVVRRLLASRTPSKHSAGSTGHAAGFESDLKRALPTSVEVEPAKRVSPRKLVKQAHSLARTYELDHVMVVRQLTERNRLDERGFSMFRSDEQPALMPPIEVWKVYADGREEQVRGLEFSGIDRRALRDIVAASGRYEAVYSMTPSGGFGAGSRGLPVHVSAPAVLVSEMALTPTQGQREPPSPVPHPLAGG